MEKTILIVRTGSLIIDFRTYNCQELGLAKALSRRGYKVAIITPDKKATHTQVLADEGLPIDVYTVTFIALNHNICWHYGVSKILDEINPNLIHVDSFNFSMSFWYQIWAEKHGVKTVVIQGNYKTTQKPIKKQLESLYNSTFGKCLIKRTNGIGGKTNWARKFVEGYCPVKTNLTRIGLDTERFANVKDIDWIRRLGLEDKKIMLYVGVQEPRRNPLSLIKLMTILPQDYVLLLVGSGPMVGEVNECIERVKLGNRVMQLGRMPQEDLPSLYKTCDLFLLASSYEIYGMVILEAMYFGLPVISTLTAGADAIIETGVDSMIIDSLDPVLWADEIRRIVGNHDILAKMKYNAHKKIVDHLVWDKTVDEFIELYNEAFKAHGHK